MRRLDEPAYRIDAAHCSTVGERWISAIKLIFSGNRRSVCVRVGGEGGDPARPEGGRRLLRRVSRRFRAAARPDH